MNRIMVRALVRLGVVVALSVGTGLYVELRDSHMIGTYSSMGRSGFYYGPMGAEWDASKSPFTASLWACVDTDPRWDWVCPDASPRGGTSYAHTNLDPEDSDWVPVDLGALMSLGTVPERDWSDCLMLMEDDTVTVSCPDGFIMES